MSPRIDIFALEITESFADIYSKLSKRIFQIPVYRDSDHIEVFCLLRIYCDILMKDFAWNTLIREPFLFLRIRN
jgi:CBS domain containing-hemolysin-like protein